MDRLTKFGIAFLILGIVALILKYFALFAVSKSDLTRYILSLFSDIFFLIGFSCFIVRIIQTIKNR
jgi:hypothetical protein